MAAIREDVAKGRGVRPGPVADEAGIARSTIYGLIAKGEIKARRIGRSLVIPPDEARRLLGMDIGEAA